MTIFFPDISSFSSGVSLHGCPVVIVKATEGTGYVNPDYSNARFRAKQAGTYLAAYHFLQQGNGSGQAAHCHSVVGNNIPLMLDVEQEALGTTVSNPTVSDAANFIKTYRSLGGICYLLYLPRWYWSGVLGSPSLQPLIDLGMLVVSSAYTSYTDNGPGWQPYGGMVPLVWQYTSSASLNGRSPVDFNAFKGTAMEFASYAMTGAGLGKEPLLREGDTGPAVGHLQARLNVWGAKVKVDNDFGPGTLTAVETFQKSHNLTVDGIVGPITWAELDKNPEPSGPPPFPAPAKLIVRGVSVDVGWEPVVINGTPVESYTVEAIGLNGHLSAREVVTDTKATLIGLNHGWTYNILVWANGGPVAPPHSVMQITV